jgi:hypothetical protein
LKRDSLSRREFLKKAGLFVAGAATASPFLKLIIPEAEAHAARHDFSISRGESVLRLYGLSAGRVKQGVSGSTIFTANYKSRGWLGNTTVTDSLGSKYFTKFDVKKVQSSMKGVELYQATLNHVCKVIANSAPAGILLRSFFIKGGSKYIPLADYSNSWYKTKDNYGYVAVFDFQQKIAMMRGTKGRERAYFCEGGFNCPIIGSNTHSGGELLARLLVSNSPNPALEWLTPGERCHLVVTAGGSLYGANIFHTPDGLTMAIPGHGTFGMKFENAKNLVLTMPGQSFGLEKGKYLKINLKKK